jgi:hypothetical protein
MTFQHILADIKWLREDRQPPQDVLAALAIVEAFVLAEEAQPVEPQPQPVRRFYQVVAS